MNGELNEETLQDIGLSKNEAKVYLSLTYLGSSTAGAVAKHANVPRPNAYDALERLREKGLVAHSIKDKKKYFDASDPRNLLGILKEKENKLQLLLPQLMLNKQMAKGSEAHIYEGAKSVRNMLDHFLEIGQTRFAYGVPVRASEIIGKYFLENYHRRRTKLRLEMKMIYNSDAKERIRWLNKMAYTESRYLPKEYDSPVTTCICGDEVVLILYQDKPLVIQIKNGDIAKAYKKYFDLFWGLAKKLNPDVCKNK